MTAPNQPALATTQDVEALLGTSVTDAEQRQVSAWLRAVSSVVRRYCRNTITRVDDDVYTVWPFTPTYDIWLPDPPIISVKSITPSIDNSWEVDRYGRLYLMTGLWWESARWPVATHPLSIVYSHGHDQVPDDIVDLVANKVRRCVIQLRINPDNLRTETIGGYSWSQRADAGEDIFLSNDEKELLSAYRRKHYSMSMA